MSVISLTAERRERLGKGGARKTRAAGLIPGVVYGHGEPPLGGSGEARAIRLALRHHEGSNPIVSLNVSGTEFTALVRDAQFDPVSHKVLHLDFQRISLTETVEVKVGLKLVGLPVGVKDGGGILEHIVREVEVRCLPTAIPQAIELDVSALNIGESLHVRDLSVPNVVILSDPDATVATVVPPTVIEEKPAEEAVTVVAGVVGVAAAPEVIKKGKKDEEEGTEEKPAKAEKKEEKKDKEKK